MSEITDTIKKFTPGLIIEHLSINTKPLTEPKSYEFHAAVLFSDITGFVTLTEKITKNNPHGAEELAKILSDYIGKIIEIITEFGGDIVKFAGDALYAIWKTNNPAELSYEMYKAARCGLEIQKKLHNFKSDNGAVLSLKVVLGMGKLQTLYVGDAFDRWELLIAGDPMNQVGYSGNNVKPGNVVISPKGWKDLLNNNFGKKQENGKLILCKIDDEKINKCGSPELPEKAESALKTYIPRAILARLEQGHDVWLADMRVVTVLFVKIRGLKYTENISVDNVQRIMNTIQKCLYKYEGSINRFGIDDKGAVLLGAFGLPPLEHIDDPLRAVSSSIDIHRELKNIGWESVIGIATGKVFCGSVGNEIRCEYTMHGTNVNLAARLMQAAETILCDITTYNAVKDSMEFIIHDPISVKGKTAKVEVFQPLLKGHKE